MDLRTWSHREIRVLIWSWAWHYSCPEDQPRAWSPPRPGRGPLWIGNVGVSCPTTAVVPTTGWPWLALERKMLCAEIWPRVWWPPGAGRGPDHGRGANQGQAVVVSVSNLLSFVFWTVAVVTTTGWPWLTLFVILWCLCLGSWYHMLGLGWRMT